MKFLFYSHSDYSDIWPVMFGQAEKYLKDYDKVLFTNEGKAPDDWDVVYYDDSLPYQQRVLSCLAEIEDEVLVFNHEDMFLYDEPDHQSLRYFSNLVSQGKTTFIKLLRGGYADALEDSEYEDLVVSPQDMVFTIQPTICKKKDLVTMYSQTLGNTIWEFESNTAITTSNNDFKGLMAYRDIDKKRGMHHYDSNTYPYVATGVVKGKWYTSDYPELRDLLKQYGINAEERGEV